MNPGTTRMGNRRIGKAPAAVVAAILLVAAAGIALGWWKRGRSVPKQPSRAVAVLPFGSAGQVPQRWSSAVFAESLAGRLRTIPGLSVSSGIAGLAAADYVVEGDIVTQERRTAIAVRLRRSGQPVPVWSATFWRVDPVDPALLTELALALAEALGNAQRPPVTTGAGSR